MKNIKFYLLASVLMFVLVAGQPHAVLASNNSTSSGLLTRGYNEWQPFYVSISSVSENLNALSPATTVTGVAGTPVYELVTSSSIPTVRVSVDIAGYTLYENSTGFLHKYGGQLFTIINGEIGQGTSGALSSDVTINLAYPDNVISFLYIGRNQDGSLEYASDTIVVRVASSESDFTANPYTSLGVPINLAATNTAADTVNTTGLIAYNGGAYYSLDESVSPVNATGLTLSYSSGSGSKTTFPTTTAPQDVFLSEAGTFTVGGTYDGAGFTDAQNVGYDYNSLEHIANESVHDATPGHVFYSDLAGVHMLETSGVAMMASSDLATSSVGSPLSVFVLADLGYWDAAQDVYGYIGSDWYGLTGVFGATNFAADGVSNMLFAQTSTVGTSTVSGSPGFGAVISLFSIGVIAYVAPRMRKD